MLLLLVHNGSILATILRRKSRGHACRSIKTLSPENAIKGREGSGPQPDRVIAMTDASHAAVMGLSNATGAVLFYRHTLLAHSLASWASGIHSASVTSGKHMIRMRRDIADPLGNCLERTCRRGQPAYTQAEPDKHAFLCVSQRQGQRNLCPGPGYH